MSFVLVGALAMAPTLASCSWNEPGQNPYVGTMAAAVDRYPDIPAAIRERLKERMAVFRYDEMVAIRRDSITGRSLYAPDIRDMHFGRGQVCGTVDRSRWSDTAVERGLVYCEGEHCLVVPTVCRNVSRVTRLEDPEVAARAAEDLLLARAAAFPAGPADQVGHGLPDGSPDAGEAVPDEATATSSEAVDGGIARLAAAEGEQSLGEAPWPLAGEASFSDGLAPGGTGPGDWPGPAAPGAIEGAPGDGGFSEGLRPSGTDPRAPDIGGPTHPGFLPWVPESPTTPIPEPSSRWLAALGLLGLAGLLHRRRRPQ